MEALVARGSRLPHSTHELPPGTADAGALDMAVVKQETKVSKVTVSGIKWNSETASIARPSPREQEACAVAGDEAGSDTGGD